MERADWSGDLDFTTVNGSITLDLPSDVHPTLRATTVNGDITTDFPITVAGRVNRRIVERHDRRTAGDPRTRNGERQREAPPPMI